MNYYGKAEEAANSIIDLFQHPENLPGAIAPIFLHRHDNVPCRAWSFHNQFLVAIAGTHDARGYRQWQEVGRYVKKGARAFHILAPCLKKIESEQSGEGESTMAIVGFKAVAVFRKADTEGAELPEDEEAQQWQDWINRLPLIDVARAWGIDVATYSGNPHTAQGRYQYGSFWNEGKTIALGVENRSTWAHELIHAADHRLIGDTFKHLPKERLEVVAELGGAVLLKCLGMDTSADLGGCFEYIQSWRDKRKSPIKAAVEVLDAVCACVNHVLDTAQKLESSQSVAA